MMNKDLEHLRLLAVFHYVVAGLAGLFSLFPILHLLLGVAFLSGAIEPDGDPDETRLVGLLFVCFASVWIVLGLLFASLLAVAGRRLGQCRSYMFCFVMAGVACAFMPFGTVLGAFTIVVLMRDSVKRLFGRLPAPATPGSPPP